MISKRGLVAAGAVGVGSVLLATGSAFACNISDFTADSVAKCDVSTGTPKAAITVTDKDGSGTPADITVYQRLADGRPAGEVLGTAHIEHPTASGTSVTILVDWVSGAQWIVGIKAGNVNDYLRDVSDLPTSASTPCEVPGESTPTSPAPGTPSNTASPTETALPTGSASPSSSTAPTGSASPSSSTAPTSSTSPTSTAVEAAASSGTPSAVPTSASPSTGALAETGSSGNTGLIAGLAAALVAVGGGLLVMQRRRGAARHH